jgi:membrane-associated PAP2 superfamily phosphatase
MSQKVTVFFVQITEGPAVFVLYPLVLSPKVNTILYLNYTKSCLWDWKLVRFGLAESTRYVKLNSMLTGIFKKFHHTEN